MGTLISKTFNLSQICLIILFVFFTYLLLPSDAIGRITAIDDYLFTLQVAGYSQEEINEILHSKEGLMRIKSRTRLMMTGLSREEAYLLIPKPEPLNVFENRIAKKQPQERKPLKSEIDTRANVHYVSIKVDKKPSKIPVPGPEHKALKRWFDSKELALRALKPIKNPSRSLTSRVLEPFLPVIKKMSERFVIPQSIVEAVIIAESGGDPKALSSQGAKGLMQLMPVTAKEVGVSEPFNPSQNIAGGCRYLRKMWDRFDQRWDLALAAYNAGPTKVAELSGIPNIPETVRYVERVLSLAGFSDAQFKDRYSSLSIY